MLVDDDEYEYMGDDVAADFLEPNDIVKVVPLQSDQKNQDTSQQ